MRRQLLSSGMLSGRPGVILQLDSAMPELASRPICHSADGTVVLLITANCELRAARPVTEAGVVLRVASAALGRGRLPATDVW